MAIRYGVALLLAYGTFFVGVWVWLHLSRYGRHLRSDWQEHNTVDAAELIARSSADLSNHSYGSPPTYGGGGGGFDGGGAAGSWEPSGALPSLEISGSGDSGGLGDAVGEIASTAAGADEGGLALVIAGVLIAAVLLVLFGAAAYLIYQAPVILAEVVFEVLLGSPLARGARALDSANWVVTLLRTTWKPFAAVSAMAMLFALFTHAFFPQVNTAGELLQLVLK